MFWRSRFCLFCFSFVVAQLLLWDYYLTRLMALLASLFILFVLLFGCWLALLVASWFLLLLVSSYVIAIWFLLLLLSSFCSSILLIVTQFLLLCCLTFFLLIWGRWLRRLKTKEFVESHLDQALYCLTLLVIVQHCKNSN